MTNLLLLGLTVLFSLTLSGGLHVHISLPNTAGLDWNDSPSDSGSIEPIEPKEPKEPTEDSNESSGMEPKNGVYMTTEFSLH